MADDQIHLAVAQSEEDGIVNDRTHVAGNFVEGRVCGNCNGGWMNELERRAKSTLKPLIEGTVSLLSIPDDERSVVSQWATKPAYVMSHAVPLKKVPPPTSADVPDEVGVYEVRDGKATSIEPEIVNWRTGGVIKSAVTLGLDKGHVNGTVAGPKSQIAISSSRGVEFYIRCLEGNSASEYQLLHFWEKSDRREFRSVTGGVLHASGGAEDNVIEFKFDKIAPRTYKILLPSLAAGEYGFLAPGAAASADLASRGKVYTFHIAE